MSQSAASILLGREEHLTFKGNLKDTRYGWLRLTPAYSVNLVAELLEREATDDSVVLDPFCGTGTTALVCAEQGIECDTVDINPFLVWLARVKTSPYNDAQLLAARDAAGEVRASINRRSGSYEWVPPLHQIEKWWDEPVLQALARGMATIRALEGAALSTATADLLKVAFCRTAIATAHVSFGHQSMSFKKSRKQESLLEEDSVERVAQLWHQAVDVVVHSARSRVIRKPRVLLSDARELTRTVDRGRYGCVITSPPYPNRMSYIRELRPYMYWLGYLAHGREAGELDWQAIGGTWGCATSNVAKWTPPLPRDIPFPEFEGIVARIARQSEVLSRYVHKYFFDMAEHVEELAAVVAPGGSLHFIVGNSKFYDVMLPVQDIYASLFEAAGFSKPTVIAFRKRSSKRELFEFVVSASKPS